ncbi:hypothetical protein [Streptomyces sp. NPDC008125]|uniref:hypothetical protein n=1 Tax=Streptomyces sp. NPDC008125 TaxID=3364811 RepID=UPI0036E9B7B0
MPHTIPLRHPLDDTGLPHHSVLPITATTEPTVAAPTNLALAIARFHHPHFRGVAAGRYQGDLRFSFAPFSGTEDHPRVPAGAWRELSREDSDALDREYEAAAILWAQARLRRQIAPLLPRAAELWTAWTSSRRRLTATFDQFWRSTDGMWRAQLLRLTDAETVVRAAAEAWDTVAEELARAVDEQHLVTGWQYGLSLTTVAEDRGIDASAWEVGLASRYTRPLPQYDVVRNGTVLWRRATPLVAAAEQLIESQRERLREVATLAGDTAG